jgi:hypothetical protein
MVAMTWWGCHDVIFQLHSMKPLKHLQHAWSLLQTVCKHVVLSANRHA